MALKFAYRIGVAALLAAMLSVAPLAAEVAGAAEDPRVTEIQDELMRLKRQVNDLGGGGTGADSVRSTLAELNERVRQVEISFQAQLGKLEEFDFRLKELEATLEASPSASGQSASSAEVLRLRQELEALRQQTSVLAARVEELSAPGARVGSSAPATSTVPVPVTGGGKAMPDVKPSTLYDEAYGLYREGKYTESQEKFAQFISRFPNHSLTDNAHFWIGESFYDQKLYEKAIIQYDKVVQNYPGSDKVALALLKQAISFSSMGEADYAKILLKKIIADHPDSEQASVARKQLELLED